MEMLVCLSKTLLVLATYFSRWCNLSLHCLCFCDCNTRMIRLSNGYCWQWVVDLSLYFYSPLSSEDRKSTRLNSSHSSISYFIFFFNDTATTEISSLSLHDALPICG